jgi:predicted RNase H-like HicB family nuclease
MTKKTVRKKIVIRIEKTKTGFSAFAVDYPIFITGTTISEINQNLRAALKLYFEGQGIDDEDIPSES